MRVTTVLGFDPQVQSVLTLILGLLVFFTVFFHVWKLIKPVPILREMLLRTYSWWVIFALYILFICFNKYLALLGFTILSLVATKEIFSKYTKDDLPNEIRGIGYILIIAQYLTNSVGSITYSLMILPVVGQILTFSFLIWVARKSEDVVDAPGKLLFSLFLTTFGLSHLSLLLINPPAAEYGPGGPGLLLFFTFLVQFNDVLQFIFGSLFGRKKILPIISPNKTWAGFLGGLAVTTLLANQLRFLTPFTSTQSYVVGFLLSFMGFVGDATVSSLKRKFNLKDMGRAIPGHGGVLDRIDSLTLSSLVYFYCLYFWND